MKNLDFEYPAPILNQQELELMDMLTKKYEKFVEPGTISKKIQSVQSWLGKLAPQSANDILNNAINAASEWDMIKKAFEHARKGFVILQTQAARFTLSKGTVVQKLKYSKSDLYQYEQICALRSYDIDKIVGKMNYKDLLAAFTEGAICGAPGLFGVPFNIAFSFLLYFRAVQSIALYYGYDVKDNPSELEIAATVTISSLTPNIEQSVDTLAGLVGKMMLAANLNALKSALNSKTLTEMAMKGGSELLFVQIRALANNAAQKALNKAGKEGIEAGIFKNLLEQVGKYLSMQAGRKAIPIIGALVGGLSDTYYMNRILKGANLIYHKRFIIEKEQRVKILMEDET